MEKDEKLVRLEEMKDSMEESLHNVVNVMEQQKVLIEIIEASNEADNFKDFCEELKEQIKDLDSQRAKLIHRKDLLDSLLAECNERETSRITTRKILDIFGIFEEK